MADLQLTDQIASNGQYTMLFNGSGATGWQVFGFKASADDVVTKILGAVLPVSDVNASYVGGVLGLFSSLLRVTFRWTQPGWSVNQVVQNLEAAASETETNFTYVSGVGGWPAETVADSVRAQLGESTGSGDGSFKSTSTSGLGTIGLILLGFVVVLVGVNAFARGYAERV